MASVYAAKECSQSDGETNALSELERYKKKLPHCDFSLLPPDLQFWLRLDAAYSKRNFTLFSLTHLVQCCQQFVLFYAVTDSAVLGAVLGASGLLLILAVAVNSNICSPVYIEYFIRHPEAARGVAKKAKQQFIGNACFNTLLNVLIYCFLVLPLSRRSKIFGPHSMLLLNVIFFTGSITGILSQLGNVLGIGLQSLISETWKSMITDYIASVHAELMDIEKPADAVMEKLDQEQKVVERFALEINKEWSRVYGCWMSLMLFYLFLMLGLIAVPPAAGTAATTRYIQISVLLAFACFILYFILNMIRGATGPNFRWEREQTRLLNTARLQNLLTRRYDFKRFDKWLDGHELSAMRAFGLRITGKLLRSFGSLLVSVTAILTYVLLRTELQKMVT